jgi:hypothetical protein
LIWINREQDHTPRDVAKPWRTVISGDALLYTGSYPFLHDARVAVLGRTIGHVGTSPLVSECVIAGPV